MTTVIRYLSTTNIAEWFGVSPATVTKWRNRYNDFPAPDAEVGIDTATCVAGWLPEREQEIRDWEANRPGQGAGGGRPSGMPVAEVQARLLRVGEVAGQTFKEITSPSEKP